MTPAAVLVGLPGAGKTTVGRRLADLLGVAFADSDDLLTAVTGRSVVDLFAAGGESAFRALEADVVASALRDVAGVLALGGGAVTVPAVRAVLRAGPAPVVLLRADLATLGARLGAAPARPLLAGDLPARLAALAAARAPLYDQVASFAVDTDRMTAARVAATIAARLQPLAAP